MTRIANMGEFRLGIVSASDKRQKIVESLLKVGCNCSPKAIAKEDLEMSEFSKYPETFYDFLLDVMGPNGLDAKVASR